MLEKKWKFDLTKPKKLFRFGFNTVGKYSFKTTILIQILPLQLKNWIRFKNRWNSKRFPFSYHLIFLACQKSLFQPKIIVMKGKTTSKIVKAI